MGRRRDIAILGRVRIGEGPAPVVAEPRPVDEEEENRIMREDDD